MAAREEGSQEDYVAHTISRVDPDYKEVQLIFGWMRVSSVAPRLGLLITDTISSFNAKSRRNTRHEATDTVSLDTPTIHLEGVDVAQICYLMTLHITLMLDLKQGMLDLKQEKQSANSTENGVVYPTESLIQKWGAPSELTSDLKANIFSQEESDTVCLPLIQDWQDKPKKYRPHLAEQLVQIATSMTNHPSSLARHLQAVMNIVTEWCTFNLEDVRAIKSHVGSKFPRDTDGDSFMVLYNESDKIVEVCELTTVKRPNQASIQSPFLKVSKPEMNNSEVMKDEMLRQYTPSIRTISWFIFLGQFCLDTGIMNVLHFSPVRRNQNLARFKPVHISLTLLEHPSIRLRADVPEFPFDRGKDVTALEWATLFQGYPTVKSPIVTSFTAVTPRLLLHLKTYLMTGSIY